MQAGTRRGFAAARGGSAFVARLPAVAHRWSPYARMVIGAASVACSVAWFVPAAAVIFDDPAPRVTPLDNLEISERVLQVANAAESQPSVLSSAALASRLEWPIDIAGRTLSDLGCADDLSAEGLDRFFADVDLLVGWDNPHLYPIDEHRTLWILHDSYLDYGGTARNLLDAKPQLSNLALLQRDNCFAVLHSGSTQSYWDFEVGDGNLTSRFFWPLGGQVDGDRLWVFWAAMVHSPSNPGDGILRHPESTWLASYDINTLDRLSFEPAPNSGASPTYGFAVDSDADYSYLFANTNMLNFTREGGFANGPHSATRMYVGRVPRGQLDRQPQYWNGTGWSDDPDTAAVISERFWAENTMQPRLLDGQWVSVVKRDGFFGGEIVIDTAPDAWGPWTEVERIPYDPTSDEIYKNSYHPVIAPWSSEDRGLIIIVSENAMDWSEAVEHRDVYLPRVIRAEWPTAGTGSRTDGNDTPTRAIATGNR